MVLVGPGCKFVRCESVEARVWSAAVIVVAPLGQSRVGVAERPEQGFVQQFVPKPAVEALDERVLDREASE